MIAASERPVCDAALAACIFAADPHALGGVIVRASVSSGRDKFLALVRAALPQPISVRKVPASIDDERLLGGLDLAATLQAGRPVLARGVLAESHGGVIVVPSAERIAPSLAGKLSAALDLGSVAIERDGLTMQVQSRFALIALDEGIGADESVPVALRDRVALHIAIDESFHCERQPFDNDAIEVGRGRLRQVACEERFLRALVEVSDAFGIQSSRALTLALRVARIHAALSGRMAVVSDDAAVAARLVLAPRATVLPASHDEDVPPPPEKTEPDETDSIDGGDMTGEMLVEAVHAAIPAGLLDQLAQGGSRQLQTRSHGQSGSLRASLKRGRPCGILAADLKPGQRLNLVETLKAAAPWQRLRASRSPQNKTRVLVRREDFRIFRFKQPAETLTMFLVDGSGSSALYRLAEAKGAVELLLSDCYSRRDQVALLVFRGQRAELLLPPTRSLARAKRSLAEFPSGGATPLASALDEGRLLAQAATRRGQTPLLVLLTDGRANIARDGTASRERAQADALAASHALRALRIKGVLVDTSQQPDPAARRVAEAMDARYIPLPRADALAISSAVKSVAAGSKAPTMVLS